MKNWTARHSPISKGAKITLYYGKQPLQFAELFELLATSGEFADWYGTILRRSDYSAYFWEHPPLTVSGIAGPAEFVLLAAPMLETVQADAGPFAEYFVAARTDDHSPTVVRFQNIGGDALLVAPCPVTLDRGYAHLGEFIRNAPAEQVREFWRVTAGAVQDRLGAQPLWLSTSGLGVAWLHARLDSSPKYYQYRPYTRG